jgi:ribonuclease Z
VKLRVIGLLLVLSVAVVSWVLTCGAWQLDQVAAGVLPLDTRSFARLTVITVGTGGPYENPDRGGPATAIAAGERIALVDAGRAVAEGLRAAGIPVSQPDTVYLTHLLPENTVGLDDLLLTGWREGRREPLRLVGPRGTRALAEAIAAGHAAATAALADALGLPPAGARIEVEEAGDGWSEQRGEVVARAGALPDGPVAALAWRFEAGGRALAVGGTGWAPEALIRLAAGADLLIHEAVFVPTPEIAGELGLEGDPERLRREAALHTSIEEVGGIARRAGVGTLALVRLRPPPVYAIQLTSLVDDSFDGRILVPEDGEELVW